MLTARNTALVDKIQKKRNCARSSCRVYASNLRRIAREFTKKEFKVDLKWLKSDAKSILDQLKKIKELNVAKNLVNAGIIGLDLLGESELKDSYGKYLVKINELKEEENKTGKLTKKQKEKTIDWASIIKLRRCLSKEVRLGRLYHRAKFKASDFMKIQASLLLSLYTHLPPKRNDYATVQFVKEKQLGSAKADTNLLVLGRGKYRFIWKDFKTYKSLGEQIETVPSVLQKLLRQHISYLKKLDPDNRNLLLNSKLEPMTRNALTKFLQSIFQKRFGKNIGSSDLRRIFLSEKYDIDELKEKEAIHRAMHHTGKTAERYYIKKAE